MIRIAICDDMPQYLESIKSLISRWKNAPNDLVIDLFEDGDTLVEAHTANPFDIIFLDIIMPLLNGIETAAEIRKNDKSVKIIFLTTSSEYAVDSYTVKANNYLLKPIHAERFFQCLDECYAEFQDHSKSILVKNTTVVHRVELRDIEYLESRGKLVQVVLSNGTAISTPDPLYYFEDQLLFDDGFYKCHRSYIVNIHKIATYSLKEVRMHSDYRIPISRSCQKEFESAYFEFVFRKAGDK